MYIIFDDEIIDSEDIKKIIEDNTLFKVDKDLCSATNREDMIVFSLKAKISDLVEGVSTENITDEEFALCMEKSDEIGVAIGKLMPRFYRVHLETCRIDLSDDTVRAVIGICHYSISLIKLHDVIRRFLSQA